MKTEKNQYKGFCMGWILIGAGVLFTVLILLLRGSGCITDYYNWMVYMIVLILILAGCALLILHADAYEKRYRYNKEFNKWELAFNRETAERNKPRNIPELPQQHEISIRRIELLKQSMEILIKLKEKNVDKDVYKEYFDKLITEIENLKTTDKDKN